MLSAPTLLPSYLESARGFHDTTHEIPDIIEFVTSREYLDRSNLYPRQATLLKVIFLQTEIMTDYDHRVINEWRQNYIDSADDKGEGNNGINPDIYERITINRRCPCGHDLEWHTGYITETEYSPTSCALEGCQCHRYRGRRWFREVIGVIGRRGSKGHIGALAGAYILWHYIHKGDVQEHYGVDRDKRLTALVFAGKKEQAKANQWGDLNNVLLGAPCYASLISRPHAESLTVESWNDRRRVRRRERRGVFTDQDIASFEILPKESTLIAGRGHAGFMQFYDEAAHVVKGVANTPAEDVYESASPALDQFGVDGFIYIPSSPWQRIGLLHDHYQLAIEREFPDGVEPDPVMGIWDERGAPAYPSRMMIQLNSWDLYEDWEIAHTLNMKPPLLINKDERRAGLVTLNEDGTESIPFKELHGAIQEYDDEMRQIERANPETFAVERRSRFAAVMDAYLNPDRIATIWEPWPTLQDVLYIKERGVLRTQYRAHGDPSKSGAQFGFAIGHVAKYDERGLPHVVFDVIHHWDPADFEDHQIDYDFIGGELEVYIENFMPYEMTFDQFNSVSTIQRLNKFVAKKSFPKRINVFERPATGPLNWKTWETFKTALGLGLIHAPYYEQANKELTFLQEVNGKVDHPDAGPVQTKDVADCLAIVTYELVGEDLAAYIGKALGDFPVSAAAQGGMDAYKEQRPEAHEQLSGFGRERGRRDFQGGRRGRPRKG